MIEFTPKGLDQVRENLRLFPQHAKPIFANAINAFLAEMHKNAVDPVLQFVTPRSQRTGRLLSSFSEGIVLASPDNLEGSIAPQVKYAPWVHEGHNIVRGGKMFGFAVGNPFMPRILNASQSAGDRHFDEALDQLADALTK